jgi:hypothetical protein
MSATWYECKVKYRKIDDNGIQKVTTEPYLVDALSYTEAERRINEEMSTNIKVASFAEIHPFEKADRWFRSKVALVAYDEESGKERKTNIYLLVQANDVKEAYDNTIHAMKNTMGDYIIPSISESPIMDVFPYFSGEDGDLEKLEKFNSVKASKIEVETMEDPLDIEEIDSEVILEEEIIEE